MKSLLTNRIIIQAISMGFDFTRLDSSISLIEAEEELLDFFEANADKLDQIEAECEVSGTGMRQSVTYGDYHCSGQIVDFSEHLHKPAGTKVFHSRFVGTVDGTMKNIKLFFVVEQTEYNDEKTTLEWLENYKP